jgi:hypothetical protein
VFAATVSPTLHDTIFYTLADEILIWFASVLVASFVGVAIVLAMFRAAQLVPHVPFTSTIASSG